MIDRNDPASTWEQAQRPPRLVPASEVPLGVRERLDVSRAAFNRLAREAKAFEPGKLTDELRAFAREKLSYRAPETLDDAERALLAAVDAEEQARAESPDTWLGGER